MKSSKVVWTEIGSLISLVDRRNSANEDLPVIGVNRDKDFMPTVANLDGIDLRRYKVIEKGNFIFSGMQTGRDICIRIGLYECEEPSLISPAYTTFFISRSDLVLPEFFFMYFCREEMDRYGAFCSDGSVRSNLDWDRFVSLRLPLPSIDEQRTIVDAWKSLRNIKEQNESLATPLMQLCQSYIQDCKHKFGWKAIGKYIKESDERNINGIYTSDDVRGVSIQKVFINTKANMEGVPVSSYKVVRKGMFAFNPNTARMGDKFSIALNQDDKEYLVSSIYPVFEVCSNELEPAYLKMWFNRIDFDRYARYNSWGSAREMFNFSDMQRVEIPLPPIEVQRAVVALYQCALEYKAIAAEADAQARSICSALMQHAINC